MTDVRVILVTVPTGEAGLAIARGLVEERLAACASLLPGLRSIYRWQGRIEDEPELLLIIKTQAGLVERLAARVKELHPYTVPEIIALPVTAGWPDYLDWVRAETAGAS